MKQQNIPEQLKLMKREDLERLAVAAVSATDYYDLMDTLEESPDEDLIRIIIENGEVEK